MNKEITEESIHQPNDIPAWVNNPVINLVLLGLMVFVLYGPLSIPRQTSIWIVVALLLIRLVLDITRAKYDRRHRLPFSWGLQGILIVLLVYLTVAGKPIPI